MTSGLLTIPTELLLDITSLLLLPDQAALARTCKTLNGQLTSTIWAHIELHHRGTHEGLDVGGELEAFEHDFLDTQYERHAAYDAQYPYNALIYKPSSRKYAQCELDHAAWLAKIKPRDDRRRRSYSRSPNSRVSSMINRRLYQYGRDELLFGVRKIVPEGRWRQLSQSVQSLCMSCGVDEEVCSIIATFSNLKSLELVGLPLAKGFSSRAPETDFPSLQNLRLRGYFPSVVVKEICQNAGSITHMDLGLIATAKDDAQFKSTLLRREDDDDDEEDSDATDSEDDGDFHDSASSGEDDGSRPWAFHSPLWLSESSPEHFVSLTHLHLIKPYNGECDYGDDSFEKMPDEYEERVYREWVALLGGAGATLREVILEHRIPMEVGDTVGDGDPGPERKGRRWNPRPDAGDEMFCDIVLRFLLEERERFPRLERLALRGISLQGISTQPNDGASVDHESTVPNDVRLRKALPTCELEIYDPVYPIIVYAGWIYEGASETKHEVWQDEGDGLFPDMSYYNDYKRRFGPDWRIGDTRST